MRDNLPQPLETTMIITITLKRNKAGVMPQLFWFERLGFELETVGV